MPDPAPVSSPFKVCVYCGSAGNVPQIYHELAIAVAHEIVAAGWELVYGGARTGLMGTVADAVLAAGGRVTGIIPQNIKEKDFQHPGLTALHVTPDLHARKKMMVEMSDAFIALPGGLGTLDEVFELLTWRQLGLHSKPLFFVDVAQFWAPVRWLMDRLIETGFCKPTHARMYQFVDQPGDLRQAVLNSDTSRMDPTVKWQDNQH
ncbi:MAG: TIGR00730 family Rossman fold protein [Pseudomonadota bacterium]